MRKSKVNMSKELKRKCSKAIHTASTASAAAGALPIPMSDAIPITAAQVTMIIALGKIFDVTLSDSAAKSILGVGITRQVGRAVFSNALKAIPGFGSIAGSVVGASTAAALTELLGWIVADDFYRMSQGEDPEDIVKIADDLKEAFKD